jgi:ApaG protein
MAAPGNRRRFLFGPPGRPVPGVRRLDIATSQRRIAAVALPASDRWDPEDRARMYSQTTRAITVTVQPIYLDDQSSPDESHFVWAYRIKIENNGGETVQLRNRYWRITDSHGRIQEVRGAGVVGEQPVLKPGETFEYTSGTPLPTPSGFMVGTYGMISDAGERFDIEIPAFSLDSPSERRTVN